MQQMTLPYEYDRETLQKVLQKLSGLAVMLTITDNTSSMLSVRKSKGALQIRLHRMFLAADSGLLNEMASYLCGRTRHTPLLRQYIRSNRHRIRPRQRAVKILPQGRKYNLAELYTRLNREYFQDRVDAAITWGSKGARRAAARRTLGSFCADDNVIRINPLLDSTGVPRYFVEYIVYHEMLHAELGIGRGKGRRIVHDPEFRRREKLFRHYERAIAWEKKRW